MFERFTERARQVVVLAQDEARTLGHGHIGTEHILLGLVRENQGIGAQDSGEILPLLSGPDRTRRPHSARAKRFIDGPSQLLVACPQCATPIETITAHQPNTTFEVTAEGDRTRPGCGKEWKIAYAVVWVEQGAVPG